jgi:hypothetical protein
MKEIARLENETLRIQSVLLNFDCLFSVNKLFSIMTLKV